MKKNPYLTFPREFTTGKWRVHLVYPGEPRADGFPWNGMVGADLDGLEAYGFAYPLSTQAATDWLEGDDLAKVNVFLKETCKEAFGILPGADDGGYSLSGEAKEAALSRFALPENRKAALNVIRKLNESRDSNDNAL